VRHRRFDDSGFYNGDAHTNGFISPASASLNASSANLEAAYGANGAAAIFPATELTLINATAPGFAHPR
jgi:hypothetical protein